MPEPPRLLMKERPARRFEPSGKSARHRFTRPVLIVPMTADPSHLPPYDAELWGQG